MLSLHRSRRFLCITTVIPLVLLLTSLGIWTRSLTIWLAPALVRFRRKPQAVADCVRLSGLRFRSMLVAHAFQSAPTFPSTIAVVYPRHDAVHTRLLRPPRRSHTLPPMSSPTVSSAPSSDSSPLVPSARSSAALGPTSRPSISVISTSEGLLRLHRASASLLHRLPATEEDAQLRYPFISQQLPTIADARSSPAGLCFHTLLISATISATTPAWAGHVYPADVFLLFMHVPGIHYDTCLQHSHIVVLGIPSESRMWIDMYAGFHSLWSS
ncbi:hypothetical protein BD309DRAFT_100862 [Dichomitus squalens]|nr:hypothetical protein BD309DRAFT_100862 [Dichomitus squalens]